MTLSAKARDNASSDLPLIVLIAGEPSGDALGARLMAALKRRAGGRLRFAGVGGEMMSAEGLTSLFPMTDLAVMGLLEVAPRLPRILARIRETAALVAEARPAAVVTIDAPDFCVRVWRRVRPHRPRRMRTERPAPSVPAAGSGSRVPGRRMAARSPPTSCTLRACCAPPACRSVPAR